MRLKLMHIGLTLVFVALLLGNLAVCIEAANNHQKCEGSKPDECNGHCVNFQSDKHNCGDCGKICNPGEVCHEGKCVGSNDNNKATCTDGKKNGKETDIDCGGPTCQPCADEKTCKNNADCSSGVCAVGFCQAPSCVDQVKNDGEMGVDCGGNCKPCAPRKPVSGIGNITVLPVQNSPGKPAPNLTLGPPSTTPSYLLVFDNFVVGETRSASTDTDYMGFGVSVNNQIVYIGHNFLGDISGNTQNPIGLESGPTPIPDDLNTQVIFGYLIVNLGLVDDESPTTNYGAIDLVTKDIMNYYIPSSGHPLGLVDNNLGYLYNSWCDGAVAAAKITMNGHDLAQRIAVGKSLPEQQDEFAGTDSRIGCGSNSRYYVRWHVKRVS
jgi:hypothetical protein